MSDVVERLADALCKASNQAIFHKDMRSALSALRPGDRLPGGLVVVSEEPSREYNAAWDFVAKDDQERIRAKFSLHTMRGLIKGIRSAMLTAAKEKNDV